MEQGLTSRAGFVVGDAMAMPFADASFDAAYVFEAGCHMPDKSRFYQGSALRVLETRRRVRRHRLVPPRKTSRRKRTPEYIEPICRLHGVPNLIMLRDLRVFLSDTGFAVTNVDNLASHGNVLRNWEKIDNKALRLLNTLRG